MAELEFEDLRFEEKEDTVRVHFMNLFYADVDRKAIERIGPYKVEGKKIMFSKASEARARRKLMQLLSGSFSSLKNKIAKKDSFYIHQNSGIPLMGTNYFGIIDRGTNLIEIKPITSCNLGCIFCSVAEGPKSRRKADFVIENDYMMQELRKLIEFKKNDSIDAHINSQGEPLLYADIVPLVADIAKIKAVKMISIDTNGVLLNRQLVDRLADAGFAKTKYLLSWLDQKLADTLYGSPYPLKHVLEIARYIPKKMDLILTPVWLPGFNDEEIMKLANFAREIGAGKNGPAIGIQNFMPYRFGRNPTEPVSLDIFFKRMQELEKKHGLKLLFEAKDFSIEKCPEYPKPFKKGQLIEAEIVLQGRLPGEMLAVARERLISVPNCDRKEGSVRLRIRRTKHNVFLGEILG